MDLEKIKKVTDTPSKKAANDLLRNGWVLLDAEVVQLSKPDGMQKEATFYILGMPEQSYVKKRLDEHQDKLFREYQSTGQLRYQTQALNSQIGALIMAAIFLLVGFSLSNLTEATNETFRYYFPFVAFISVSAFAVWAAYTIYMSRVQKLLVNHEIELEEKLGFNIQALINKEIEGGIIPQTMPIFITFPSIRTYWPFWFIAGLAIMLGGLYSAVIWSTYLFSFAVLFLMIFVIGFLGGFFQRSFIKRVGTGFAGILFFLVGVVRWIVRRKKKLDGQ